MTADTRALIAASLSPHRVAAAEREFAQFVEFCDTYNIGTDGDSVFLYLTAHLGDGGRPLSRRLARLDLGAILRDDQPPSRNPRIRRFLRGAHTTAPLGPVLEKVEPLYTGHVRTLVDTTMSPTWSQLRDVAFVLLLNATGLRITEVYRLRWSDLRLEADRLTVAVDLRKGRPVPVSTTIVIRRHRDPALCPLGALRRLRSQDPTAEGLVFATRGTNIKNRRLTALGQRVTGTRTGEQRLGTCTIGSRPLRRLVQEIERPTAIAVRDRAILLLGHLAALGNEEAFALNVGDVSVATRGLVLRLPSRPHPTVGIPSNGNSAYDPVAAWLAWRIALQTAGLCQRDRPAFVPCDPTQPLLRPQRLSQAGFADVVNKRASEAGLDGRYGFTSLRYGFVASALRAGTPSHIVAQHVGVRSLEVINRRASKESLLNRNIASSLGL